MESDLNLVDAARTRGRRLDALPLAALVLVIALGILLRVYPSAGFTITGYDERLYRGYVNDLIRAGLGAYPDYVENYVALQSRLPAAILPPTRFLYIFPAYLWHQVTGAEALAALHHVSCLFSILMLLASTAFAWRLGGRQIALGVAALMSFSPLQIHMSQHALIDGVLAFWATLCLWLLWENLRQPGRAGWLISYTFALTCLVLTKENAMFTYLGLLALLGANHWLRFGKVTSALLGLSVVGPLLGVVILVFLCGGLDTFINTYRLLVSKASVLPFAIATGDGPWYRYLVDLLLISPVILILAFGGLFRLRKGEKAAWYLVLFVAATYLVMCNIRYGMNLRYATIWDLPLRYLALLAVGNLAGNFLQRRNLFFVVAITLLCAIDLRQYYVFFVQDDLYELITEGLLRALKILK